MRAEKRGAEPPSRRQEAFIQHSAGRTPCRSLSSILHVTSRTTRGAAGADLPPFRVRTRGRGEVYTGDEVYTGWGSGAAPSDPGPVVSSLCWVPSSSWSARVAERPGGGLSACRWGLCAGTRKGEALTRGSGGSRVKFLDVASALAT